MCATDTPRPPRTYYARKLLEHGPLTLRAFTEITGWRMREAAHTLLDLDRSGAIQRTLERGTRRYIYGLQ